MTVSELPVRAAIREMLAYSVATPDDCDVKLDQNELPFDFPPELKREVLARFEQSAWNRYPAIDSERLRAALATKMNLEPENVLVGNGSNELLFASILTFVSPGRDVVVLSPSFAMYETFVAIAGGRIVRVEVDPSAPHLPADGVIDAIRSCSEPPVVILCSPNNPTGGVLASGDLERIVATGAIVLLDRAYGEFDDAALPEVADRLVVFSTFSKSWGLAALRVGWLYASEALCREIRKVQLPYAVNAFSEEVALAALQRPDLLDGRRRVTVRERDRLYTRMLRMSGVTPFPSRANFVAFRVDDSRALFDHLALAGVLVRDLGRFRGMSGCLRVTVGTREENDAFLAALDSFDRGAR